MDVACNVRQPGCRTNGITEFMHVASLTAAHDLPIAPHGAQEVHVHLGTAIANGLILEVYRKTVTGVPMP
jgi:L-alanine-DL-glutamate epimerase-like enolase superfamily enzyme